MLGELGGEKEEEYSKQKREQGRFGVGACQWWQRARAEAGSLRCASHRSRAAVAMLMM